MGDITEINAEAEQPREIVYILTNPSMPGLIKIGRTRNLDARVTALSSATQVPEPFEVAYAAVVMDAPFVERALHVAFAPHRMRGKEFFRLAPESAIAALSLAEVEQVSLAIDADVAPEDVIAEIRQRGRASADRKSGIVANLLTRLKSGEKFDSQDELAAHYGVSKTTFSDWLIELEASGLIARVQDGRCKRLTAA